MFSTKTNSLFMFVLLMFVASCTYPFSSPVIAKPDEYTRVYEAKEKFALRAVARVIKEKSVGIHVVIDEKNHRVDSDYFLSDGWRTKATAVVKQINWKECEVTLSVITEKQTKDGWEMRRLLEKDQYDVFFNAIDLKIYEEMSRI